MTKFIFPFDEQNKYETWKMRVLENMWDLSVVFYKSGKFQLFILRLILGSKNYKFIKEINRYIDLGKSERYIK